MMMGDCEDVIPDLIVVVVVCNSTGSSAVVTGSNYKKMTAEEGNISCDPVIMV